MFRSRRKSAKIPFDKNGKYSGPITAEQSELYFGTDVPGTRVRSAEAGPVHFRNPDELKELIRLSRESVS